MSRALFLNIPDAPGGGSDQWEQIAFLQMPPGDYVVLAKGQVTMTWGGDLFFRLEVGGVADVTAFHHSPGPAESVGAFPGYGTFALVLAVKLPYGGGVGSVGAPTPPPVGANLFVRKRQGGVGGIITNLRIVAFQIDDLSIVTA
jgi:hypothetical protein